MAGPARRLWALVKNLPQESASFYEQGFTRSEEMLATLLEAFTTANFEKGLNIPRPSRPLPGVVGEPKPRPPNVYSIAEFAARHKKDMKKTPPKEGGE